MAAAVTAADAHCRARGLHFTPQRRRVLEILLDGHRAMGAYDILERLRDEGLGSQPPVAYRALDFLVAQGFAHKIERINAFVACAHSGAEHDPAFLICRVCCAVAEAEAGPARTAITAAARGAGFRVERVAIEAEGLCPRCAEAA
ncbi:MAG: transcriptional repressor [Roseovarius sp.]|nr:transcriptional repressor [Roseovarius sp.]